MLLIAMDRAPSVRSYDKNGRLHIAVSNISKANVCPYLGREIPGWQQLGLDPGCLYNLLRDPAELAKGIATFNNLPVLSEHVPVTAFDEESHMAELVVGSTGTDAAVNGAFVTNSLVVWAKPSIDAIERNEKRELSSAYYYRADMTPGIYEGVAYDGVMRDIVGYEVALVFAGRAGPDVVVGDEKPMALKSMRALMLAGGLGGLIRPLLAQDAKLDIGAALVDVNDKTISQPDATGALAEKIYGLAQPHLAQDAKLELGDVRAVVDSVAGMALDGADEIPEPKTDPAPAPAPTEPGTQPAPAPTPAKEDPPAMDEAAINGRINAAADKARTDALAEAAAIRTAEREVGAVVGELAVAMDSAEAVYRVGLDALGVDHAKLTGPAVAETFRAVKAARDVAPPAMDGRPAAGARRAFSERFPNRPNLIRG